MSSAADPGLRKALVCLEQGDWEAAHAVVQSDESSTSCWLHGIVHVMEGDMDNARYWYRRAHREFSEDLDAEIAAAKKALG